MASWTKATLAARILESLGVVGEGQDPTSEQSNRTQEIIDSVYDLLKPQGLVPFLTSAIPEWAQQPLLKVVAAEVAPRFGYTGSRLGEKVQLAAQGKRQLAEGVAAEADTIPTQADYS